VSPTLMVDGLYKRHRARGPAVLNGISLEVPAGQVGVVVGPSGAGKTTLLRCIAGLLPFDAGTVHLGRREASVRQPAALLGEVGFVFQAFDLFPHLTVRGNCLLGPHVVRGEAPASAQARVDGLLAQLALEDVADAFPATLSGGQRQRVAIARALAMAPSGLVWDEPTSALDSSLRSSVVALIHGVASSGIPQLVVTHDLEFARAVGGSIYPFMDGRLTG
jgi:ABC-type polar amino acid transport system ATPase subunit